MKLKGDLARAGIAVLATAVAAWAVEGTLSAPYGPPTAANTWQQFTIPLSAATFSTDAATFSSILSNVTRFRIRTEMRSGTDVAGLDEVAVGSLFSATFASSPEGWSASGDGTMSWVSTGGYSGGFVRVSDWANGDWHYAVAPGTWLGDWTAAIGSSITFWIRTDHPDLAALVEITGGGVVQQLSLTSSVYAVGPGRTASMTVGISQVRTVATTVTLSSSSTAAFTVPASVVIPAGERTVGFLATAGTTAGTSATIAAAASGYSSSRVTLQVVSVLWQVVFQAENGGSLSSGTESGRTAITQTVADGQSCAAVVALPDTGYVFVEWTRNGATYPGSNPLTVTNVAADMTITAHFAVATYTLTYLADANGSVSDPAPQTVSHGADGTPVEAQPAAGFVFARWSDGRTDNPRADTQVTSDLTVTALFEACDTTPDAPSPPARVDAARHSTVVSEAVTVAGLTCPAAIAVSGGEYRIGSGPWTSAVGTVTDGEQVSLRQTSAPEWSTTTLCRLDIGDVVWTWSVTTEGCHAHQADQNGDWSIQLTPELTRLIQFYNRRGYHCQAGTEDGYAAGPAGADPGDPAGDPHQADQNGDWQVQLSPELTRLIQFYNSGGYECAEGTEDGYAPAADARKAMTGPGTLAASRSQRACPDAAGTTEVCLSLKHSQPESVTSLVVRESLPPGWQFAGTQGLEAPAIVPRTGDTGVVAFAWVSMPTEWPVRLVYRIRPSLAAKAGQSIRGQAGFRAAAGETVVGIPATEVRRAATIVFRAAAHGSIGGPSVQTVLWGDDTAPVMAVAETGYRFDRWSDGSGANPRVVSRVAADLTLTASFRAAAAVAASGRFTTVVDAAAVSIGRGLWDLSGTYATTAAGYPLVLDLVHDAAGKLSGLATYAVAGRARVAMPIRGSVAGVGGSITMSGAARGTDPAKAVRVSLSLGLAVDTGTRRLVGPLTGSVSVDGVTTPVTERVALPIPAAMDGTWTLAFQLAQSGPAVSGTALLALANGARATYVASGRLAGQSVVLTLGLEPGDSGAGGPALRATITPLEGGAARLDRFQGRDYGQALSW